MSSAKIMPVVLTLELAVDIPTFSKYLSKHEHVFLFLKTKEVFVEIEYYQQTLKISFLYDHYIS